MSECGSIFKALAKIKEVQADRDPASQAKFQYSLSAEPNEEWRNL